MVVSTDDVVGGRKEGGGVTGLHGVQYSPVWR